jgi:hypothetical protein
MKEGIVLQSINGAIANLRLETGPDGARAILVTWGFVVIPIVLTPTAVQWLRRQLSDDFGDENLATGEKPADHLDLLKRMVSDIRQMVERIHSRGPGQGEEILSELKKVRDELGC